MSEWQPIETAPKDGTKILLCGTFGNIAVGRWSGKRPPTWKSAETGSSLWMTPAHWMPLPAPPEAERTAP